MNTMGQSNAYEYERPSVSSRSKAVQGRGLRVLLVEDALYDEVLTAKALRDAGTDCQLDIVRAGHEVLPYFAACQRGARPLPDLIILDLGMPGMDGLDILEYLASSAPALQKIPIAILTGYEHLEPVSKMNNLPIVAYIMKPCNKEKILNILASVEEI